MYGNDASPQSTLLTDPDSGRRWYISPLGRHVLALSRSGAVTVAMEKAAPVLLKVPRHEFSWPTSFFINDVQSTVTVPNSDRRAGEPGAWIWRIPRRIIASIALPEPTSLLHATAVPDLTSDNIVAPEAQGVSPDGRYAVTYGDNWEPGIIVDDRVTGRSGRAAAGYYSRRWPVGGPWWSPGGEWLLCAWYTTKIFDHGWISAISRDRLDQQFATKTENDIEWWDTVPSPEPDPHFLNDSYVTVEGIELEWTVTGYPNGVPYPRPGDEIGSYEATPVAGFSADASAVYFVDSRTVSGFSFPHMVPLFRVPRPELTTLRQTVSIPTTEVPFATWTSSDRLVVATHDGQVGSIWLDLGLSWVQELETDSHFLAFDAEGASRAAITDSGALLRWSIDTQPRQIGSFPHFLGGPCAVKFLDDENVIVGGLGGELLLLDGAGKIRSQIGLGLSDVVTLQVSADRSHVAALSTGKQCRKVRLSAGFTDPDPSPLVGISHCAFADTENLMLIDSEDFLHLSRQDKRHVNHDGSLGASTAPEIVVRFMGDLLAAQETQNNALALACHPTRGVAVATRSAVVGQFDPATDDGITTHLGGDIAEKLQFSPDGAVLMASSRSAIHLLTLFG